MKEKKIKNKISIGIILLIIFIFPINVLAAKCPRASYDVIPGMIQPGNNITLQAKAEGFSADEEDQDRMNYVWCIDNVPLNTLNAGSADKIVGNEVDGYSLESEYGDIKGNFDKICNPAIVLGVFSSQEVFRYDDGEATCLRRDNRLYCNKENLDRIAERNLLSIDLVQKRIRIIQEGDNFWLPFTDIGNISYGNYVIDAPAPPEFYITRETTVDTDGDGLDDNWEIKYFKGRRISTIIETEDGDTEDISFYMPNEDGAVLSLVGPDRITSPDNPGLFVTDPDGDAWEYPFEDEDNNYGAPWMIGTPYLKSSTSDVLVNPGLKSNDILREYLAGTNPLSSDTDDDGIKDGEDFVGKQQDNVHFVVKKEYGDKYNVMLRIFGVDDKYRNEDGDKKYALFTYPAQEDSACGFEATPEGENEFEVGLGLPLKVGWSFKPSPPIPGDEPITIIAETSKLTENAGLDLEFKWFLNGRQEENIVEEGYGKKIFQYTTTTPTCASDNIGLEILEKNTNRLNFQEFEIPIGFGSDLIMDVIANVDLENEEVRQFNERKGTSTKINFDNIDDQPFVLDQDAFKGRINEEEGFRTGDLVRVRVNNIKDNFGRDCEVKYKVDSEENRARVRQECEAKYSAEDCDEPYELAMQNFNFKWNFKGKEQQMQSGKGPDFQEMYVILRDGPRNIGEPTGEEAESLSYGSNESVTIEILDDAKDTIARDKRNFEIKPPGINFDIEGAETDTSEEDNNQPTYYAGDGDITIHANLDYWRPSRGFTYKWLRNGEKVNEMSGTWDTIESSYTFRPGIDINGQATGANKDIITLEVESEINYEENNGNLLTEKATKTIEINLSGPEADRENVGVAGSLNKLIPRYYKNVFNLFFIFGLTGLVTMLILGFVNKTSIKK